MKKDSRRLPGTEERVNLHAAQHMDLGLAEIDTEAGRAGVMMNGAESPLVWLARRKGKDGRSLIATEQLQAGERLRADFTRANMMPRTLSNWSAAVTDGPRGPGQMNFSDSMIAARQRVTHAINAVGPEFSGLLLDVCCFLKGLEDCERERSWPPRCAKVVLQLGLAKLARHYGYGAVATGPRRTETRSWTAPNTEGAPA